MAKFKITLQFETKGELGLHDVVVDAVSIHPGTDWIAFSSVGNLHAQTIVAVFPKDRVIGVQVDEE